MIEIGTRFEIRDDMPDAWVDELVCQSQLQVLQTAVPLSTATWEMLNERFFAVRQEVELRVYGHYGIECDLSFVSRMTHVQHFSADSLQQAKNLEAIATIPNLESLSIGIYELTDFAFLERIPSGLSALRIHATRSKKPSLAPLKHLSSLKLLYLERQCKDIEVLSELHALEDLTLRSVTTPDLTYLAKLPNLWSLDIKLGGIRDFSAIWDKTSLKYLELWQIRELPDVGVIGRLPGLQNLYLQSLPHVVTLPSLPALHGLRRVIIHNLKRLQDFSPLEGAPALQEFALLQGASQTPRQLLPVLKNPVVRRVNAFFGSHQKNSEFSRLRERYGKQEWQQISPRAFEYN